MRERRLYLGPGEERIPVVAQFVDADGGAAHAARLLEAAIDEGAVTCVAQGNQLTVLASVWHSIGGQWRCDEPVGVAREQARETQPLPSHGDVALVVGRAARDGAALALEASQVVVDLSTERTEELCSGAVEAAGERATVLLDASDLRRLSVHLTEGISWERSALDVLREVAENPELALLRRARHLVVRFDLEGALLVELRDGHLRDARLVYDPTAREGDQRRKATGGVPGTRTAFAAGVAAHIDKEASPGSVLAGVQTGIAAARTLFRTGHGPSAGEPAYPESAVLAALGGEESPLPVTTVPCDLERGEEATWTILGSGAVGAEDDAPLLEVAQRLALEGLDSLWDVPRHVAGHFVTVDRTEIEAVRALEQLIRVYLERDQGLVPLSIGVFGPPGAGKSFAVKQLGKELMKGGEVLEFNLSQFEGPADLLGALHQVRDAVLRGSAAPLVFFDEFDSKSFEWLRYLLAPMQDGRFQEGQISHAVGKCVFVFAGGTSHTFDEFGTCESNEQKRDFALAKGPDFRSRLSGFLDVLGPNRRGGEDVAFPLRRALMVRSILGARGSDTLDIDLGLLAGLLGVATYHHGSRSLQKTLYYLQKRGAAGRFRRSDLPAAALLEPHVDVEEVLLLASDPTRVARAGELARAIHFHYAGDLPHARWAQEFQELPPQIRADNYAAAARMGRVLDRAGLEIVGAEDARALTEADAIAAVEEHLEILAEAEHDGWMSFKERCGWRIGDRQGDRRSELLWLTHHLLIRFEKLPPEEKKKDCQAVRAYPDQLAHARLGLAVRGS